MLSTCIHYIYHCIGGIRRVGRYQREVIRIHKSKKDRQHNGQKKKYERTNNDLQNIHIKIDQSNTNLTKNREWTQVVTFSVVDYELEPLSGLYNVYLLLTSNHADLRTKSKDWIAWNQDNVSKWSEMSTCINCCFSELAL
jgi:hypothetical protein